MCSEIVLGLEDILTRSIKRPEKKRYSKGANYGRLIRWLKPGAEVAKKAWKSGWNKVING